jgi:hypothetical protein
MLPLIYDMITHGLTLAERRDVNTPMIIMQAVSLQLRKFNEKRGMNTGETTLYAAVLDLLANLSFPIPGANPMAPVGPNQGGPFIPPQMQQMPLQMNPQMPMDMPQGPPPHMMNQIGNQMNIGMNMGGGGPND